MEHIDKKLLEKYFQGNCTETEKKLVEEWLEAETYEEPLKLERAQKDQVKTLMWQDILAKVNEDAQAPVFPLYQRALRYAAVACVFLGVFMAGRLSVQTSYATPKEDAESTEFLYFNGPNGTHVKLPGEKHRVRFQGRLRFFNGSVMPKFIICGEKEFVLNPGQAYYLSGSDEHPVLTNSAHLRDRNSNETELEGDYSILRLHE